MRLNKMKRTIVIAMLTVTCFSGCTQANKVSANVSKEADNFNVIRRFTVINARTDKPVYEIVGAMSFELRPDRIILTVETGEGEYKKHSIGLNEWTIWGVEDIGGVEVSPYHYEVNLLPEMIKPITFTSND